MEMLRVASLARTMLIRLKYLHICSPVYCLKESTLDLPPACPLFAVLLLHSRACVASWCICVRLLHSARKHARMPPEDRSTCRFFFPWRCPDFLHQLRERTAC